MSTVDILLDPRYIRRVKIGGDPGMLGECWRRQAPLDLYVVDPQSAVLLLADAVERVSGGGHR